MHLPPWQITLFYILIFASIAAMVLQIVLRSRKWMSGKPISWKPAGFGAILSYVVGQRKVKSSRPATGAPMHLFIFYGFLALFVATTLLAISTYSPVKFHKGTYYLAYEAVFDFLGLFFVAGIVWAIRRRLGENKEAISRSPSDMWALILLLTLGVTGYVLEAARIANAPEDWDRWSFVGFSIALAMKGLSNEGYVAIWWVHMLLVAALFVCLPQMRIRHIVMAILTSWGFDSNNPIGRLEPITMEEVEATGQIGVATPKDYSRWHLMSLDACMECGRCTDACPANGVGKVLNPKRVVQDIRRIIASDSNVAEAVSEEALWACTTCNACVEACPVLIRHVDLIVDARRWLVAEGRLSGTGAVMLRQLGSTGNAWGAQASTREDWMKGLDIPLCRDGNKFEYLLWVGCAGATDPGAVRTTKAFAGLLKKAGVSFACLGQEETCTGDPARRVGDEFLFQEKGDINAEAFKRYGVTKVLTPCPHCFNTLRHEYGHFGLELEVWHHSQFLADLVGQGKIKGAKLLPGSTALHDPCYLARINNESDAPRHILGDKTDLNRQAVPEEGGTMLAEPANFGRKTLCCGAGGGRMFMEEPPEQRPGNRRAKELLETGAKRVAVACPFCRIMLDASIKQETDKEIELVDVAELVAAEN